MRRFGAVRQGFFTAAHRRGGNEKAARERTRGRLVSRSGDEPKISPRSAQFQPLAMVLMRIGLSTNSANKAARTLRTAATMNTACQLPVAVVSTLASGTSKAAVPLAV